MTRQFDRLMELWTEATGLTDPDSPVTKAIIYEFIEATNDLQDSPDRVTNTSIFLVEDIHKFELAILDNIEELKGLAYA